MIDLDSIIHYQTVGIQDTIAEPGKFLIHEFASRSTLTDIDVLGFDCKCSQIHEELSSLGKTTLFHDCLPTLDQDVDPEEELEKVLKPLEKKYPRFVIVDSLSTLFMQKESHLVYRIIRRLTLKNTDPRSRLIFLLHEDTLLNPKPIIAHLKLSCNVWIRVLPGPRVNVAIRKSNGKLITESFKCDCSSNESIVWDREESADTTNKMVPNGGPVSTFKMTLSESEKKERDAVKLPYERHEDDDEPGSSATITYEPDEFDDWDEEDPDNDLEFS